MYRLCIACVCALGACATSSGSPATTASTPPTPPPITKSAPRDAAATPPSGKIAAIVAEVDALLTALSAAASAFDFERLLASIDRARILADRALSLAPRSGHSRQIARDVAAARTHYAKELALAWAFQQRDDIRELDRALRQRQAAAKRGDVAPQVVGRLIRKRARLARAYFSSSNPKVADRPRLTQGKGSGGVSYGHKSGAGVRGDSNSRTSPWRKYAVVHHGRVIISHSTLTADDIDGAVAKWRGRLRGCYQWQLDRAPSLRGKLVVRFVVKDNGDIASVSVSGSLDNTDVRDCVAAVFRRLQVRARGGGQVRYPLVFQSQLRKRRQER